MVLNFLRLLAAILKRKERQRKEKEIIQQQRQSVAIEERQALARAERQPEDDDVIALLLTQQITPTFAPTFAPTRGPTQVPTSWTPTLSKRQAQNKRYHEQTKNDPARLAKLNRKAQSCNGRHGIA